jgi:hypothetical protein
MLYVFIAMWTCITAIGVATIFKGPLPIVVIEVQEQEGLEPNAKQQEAIMTNRESFNGDISLTTMIFTRQFAVLYLMNTFSVLSGIFVITNYKAYG